MSRPVFKPRAVVFDLDGTLVDSLPDISDALNSGFAASGLRQLPMSEVRNLVGGGVARLVERALEAVGADPSPAAAEHLRQRVITAYATSPCVKTVLYPDARDALAALARDGVKLGLCTNKPQAITDAILDELDVASWFGSVVGARSGLPLKPARDLLDTCFAELGVSPGDAVMVGDSAADVGAARAAGCRVVVMAYGYTQTPPERLGADAVVASFADLAAAITALA